MSADELLTAVAALNPGALARARRLACAIRLVRAGTKTADAVLIVRQQHACSRGEAWRVVSMAVDMAAPLRRAGG
jgi:hypothetical protein